jgi:hypothetical protein
MTDKNIQDGNGEDDVYGELSCAETVLTVGHGDLYGGGDSILGAGE